MQSCLTYIQSNQSLSPELSPIANSQKSSCSVSTGMQSIPLEESVGPESLLSEDELSTTSTVASNTIVSVVRHIATYLCVNDVESLCSFVNDPYEMESMNGKGDSCECSNSLPELMGLSFDGLEAFELEEEYKKDCNGDELNHHNQIVDFIDENLQRRLQQERIRDTIFKNEISLRSYCLLANELVIKADFNLEKYEKINHIEDPETHIEVSIGQQSSIVKRNNLIYREKGAFSSKRPRPPQKKFGSQNFVTFFLSKMLKNIPLSIFLDVSEAIFETSIHSTVALFTISSSSINALLSILADAVNESFSHLESLNPFKQNLFLFFTKSSQGLSTSRDSHQQIPNIFLNNENIRSNDRNYRMNDKIIRKLNRYDPTAKVISYMEREDDSLTENVKKRVQKMMHYQVPLRPFVATVMAIPDPTDISTSSPLNGQQFSNNKIFTKQSKALRFPSNHTSLRSLLDQGKNIPSSPTASSSSQTQLSASESPFMCTPKSFPPSPSSRSLVMARSTRFAEDVVFLARDQLRVEGALESDNARTRAMAKALREGSRLAVFNAHDANGIHLTYGQVCIIQTCLFLLKSSITWFLNLFFCIIQHCATKVSNAPYCSIRSMVPILRNCYVYFEMTVIPPSHASFYHHQTLASLSIGLSTLDMPLNTLVGSWKSSVGLCTNGQILTGGRWCSPLDPHYCAYGNNSTVGCLVRLDDDQTFHTWDGKIVTASITFNVNANANSHVVSLPLCGVAPVGAGDNTSSSIYSGSNNAYNRMHSYNIPSHSSPENTLQLLVPREQEIFPTLTLHSGHTQVMCRFSREDIRATSRESIGAPRGVTVYAVDGSVLFDDSEDIKVSESSIENQDEDHMSILSTNNSLDMSDDSDSTYNESIGSPTIMKQLS